MTDVAITKHILEGKEAEHFDSVIQKLKARFLTAKTPQCKHKNNCVVNAIKGLLKSFMTGVAFKISIQVLTMLIKRKFDLLKIVKNATSGDTFYFSSFVAGVTFLYKASL